MYEILGTDSKETFEQIYQHFITRSGSAALLDYIETTDFFDAPASAKYHLSRKGGLATHPINVFHRLFRCMMEEYHQSNPWSMESLAIISLLHDLCKINTYVPTCKNVKSYAVEDLESCDRRSIKHDDGGDFIWKSVQTFAFDEDYTFGHGEKSVYIIQQFMRLTPDEAQAIRYHMGAWKNADTNDAGKVFEKNHLALWLSIADQLSTFIDEERMNTAKLKLSSLYGKSVSE